MNEYILFDVALCQRFLAFLAGHGVPGEVRPDLIEGFVVTAPDGLPDEIDQAIEVLARTPATFGLCVGKMRSTPSPITIRRTVNVSARPVPRRRITRPVKSWMRSLSPSGILVATSTVSPTWKSRAWGRR